MSNPVCRADREWKYHKGNHIINCYLVGFQPAQPQLLGFVVVLVPSRVGCADDDDDDSSCSFWRDSSRPSSRMSRASSLAWRASRSAFSSARRLASFRLLDSLDRLYSHTMIPPLTTTIKASPTNSAPVLRAVASSSLGTDLTW